MTYRAIALDGSPARLDYVELEFSVPEGTDPGPFEGDITFPIVNASCPDVVLKYRGRLIGCADAEPGTLFFGYVQLGKVGRASSRIHLAQDGIDPESLKVESTRDLELTVQLLPARPPNDFVLEVEYSPTSPGAATGVVKITDGRRALCELRVVAFATRGVE